jgi:Fe2+ or Zn2+ uptake regulation protein
VTGSAAYVELRERRGFSTSKPNVYRELDNFAEMGFVTKEEGGYRAVPG